MVLGDQRNGVVEFRKDFQTAPRELEAPFDGLVRVGDATHGEDLRLPLRRCKLTAEKFGRRFLHKDERLEIEAS